MLQIINISQARKNLAQTVRSVATTKKKVVIVQDSVPSVVLVPYDELLQAELRKEKAWNKAFGKMLKQGQRVGKKFLAKKGLTRQKLSDQDLYDLIKYD